MLVSCGFVRRCSRLYVEVGRFCCQHVLILNLADFFGMPYRKLCNDVQREGAKLGPDLASGLFCYVPLHDIWYGILLHPYPAQEMEAYPVSRLVNSPKHDTKEVIEPA